MVHPSMIEQVEEKKNLKVPMSTNAVEFVPGRKSVFEDDIQFKFGFC